MAAQMVLIPGHVSDVVGSVALIYALQLGFSLKTTCYFMVQAEGVLASSERIAELTNEPEQEPVRVLPEDEHLQASGWPGQTETVLAFEDVCLRYQPHLPRALDGITAQLLAGEKIGIVGRTGSGKSTIMGTIFRLFEIEKGRILLGGQDISRIGLRALRRQITIVPQDPILFSGCLRQNLDPLGVRTDDELRSVLSRCYLDELMQGLNGGLSAAVAEGGSNFSLGERQVLCLARALLRQAKVLCLDEATANIDPTNDKRIQDVLSNDFGDCLMLTIAHRLHTVIRYNRIMVLDAGRLAQLDTPANLLAELGIFQGLANQAGITAEFCASGTVSI
jgi:ATP-binding cassette subfamily C (CFTR/MRP) protein 10